MTYLPDTDAVIDAVGGTNATAALCGCTPTRVSNWRGKRRFPAWSFKPISQFLIQNNLKADLDLWPLIPSQLVRDPAFVRSVRKLTPQRVDASTSEAA